MLSFEQGWGPWVRRVKYERQHMSSSEDSRRLGFSTWQTNTGPEHRDLSPSLSRTHVQSERKQALGSHSFDFLPDLQFPGQQGANGLPNKYNIHRESARDRRYTAVYFVFNSLRRCVLKSPSASIIVILKIVAI